MKNERKANRSIYRIFFGVGVLIILLAGAYFLFFNKSKENTNLSFNASTKDNVPDETIKKLKALVIHWNDAVNNRNIKDITDLYADEVVLYRIQVNKEAAVSIFQSFFQNNQFVRQEISGEIETENISDGIVLCSFLKKVTQKGKTTDYPSYIKFVLKDNSYKIIEEGDKITDYNLGKKERTIPSYAISGDFDGDGIIEYAWAVPPKLNSSHMDCIGGCFTLIMFSKPSIPSLRFDMSIGADVLQNIGNVDDIPGDEIALVPSWFTSCWKTGFGISFRNGLWKNIVDPFSVHCELIEKGENLIRKAPEQKGYVIVNYSDMEKFVSDENNNGAMQTKIVPLK